MLPALASFFEVDAPFTQRRKQDALRLNLTVHRMVFCAEQTTAGVPPKLIRAPWAFTAAQEREQLQKRHADERSQTRNLPRTAQQTQTAQRH